MEDSQKAETKETARDSRETQPKKTAKDSQKAEAEETASDDAGPAVDPAKQTLVAAAVAAIALTIVMALVLLGARGTPPAVEEANTGGRSDSPQAYARYIKVDRYAAKAGIGALGARELIIEGYVTNTGARTVAAADLRCYFSLQAGGRTHYDFPLVVDTLLGDLGDGPLEPKSGRKFAVRMGGVPDGLASVVREGKFLDGPAVEITRIELVNIRLENG